MAEGSEPPVPDYKHANREEIWDQFFKNHRLSFRYVRSLVRRLFNEKEYEQAISCLQAALIHGQGQPWMYEVLAISMEAAGRPKAEVERVVLSLTDFGQVDFETMMYSGAYLARFKRPQAAARMYRQASRLLPERQEPYALALKLAPDFEKPEDVQWAVCGALQNYWGPDYQTIHQQALDIADQRQRQLIKQGDAASADGLKHSVELARQVDLRIRLEWSGAGDLDLQIEEPAGTICSYETRETIAGGRLLHDGCGPLQSNCYEEYVCPLAMIGNYRLQVVQSWGQVVGNRAVLTITKTDPQGQTTTETRTLILGPEKATHSFRIATGRRTAPRQLGQGLDQNDLMFVLEELLLDRRPVGRTAQGEVAAEEFFGSRVNGGKGNTPAAGAFGFQPTITTLPSGTALTARAIVSPDRRYVRLAVFPRITEVTDVFTFSFLSGGGGAGGGNGNGGGTTQP